MLFIGVSHLEMAVVLLATLELNVKTSSKKS